MKKLLSLTLVTFMLLSSLTSCDLETVKGHVVNFLEQFTTTVESEKVVRTTITEEEFEKALNIQNATVDINLYGQKINYTIDGLKIKASLQTEYASVGVIMDMESGTMISETKAGCLAYVDKEMAEMVKEELDIFSIAEIPEGTFEKLTYNEESKSYSFVEEGGVIELFFEEGALTKLLAYSIDEDDDIRIEFKEIGTSTVELPEYTIINDGKVDPSKAPADVRTTVTNEELAAHLELRNFTINAGVMMYYLGIDASLKVADTALELYVNYLGETMQQYVALVDGKFYSIEKYGDGHLATDMNATMDQLNETIEIAREYMSTEYLTYDEEGRYYKLNIEGVELYLYFENGKLVKGVYLTDETGMDELTEIVFTVTDLGTTTVTLPEFEINDSPVMVD